VSVALLILAITLVVSLLALYSVPGLQSSLAFRPYGLARRGDYHTLFTHGFVHADLPHLVFNAMTFYFFAFGLERVIGSAAFAVLYLLALPASEIGPYLTHRSDPRYVTLGASGAVTAVLFASIVYFPMNKLIVFPIPVPIPAPVFAVLFVALSIYADRAQRDHVNHAAHLWGALFGLVFVAVTDPGAYTRLLALLQN
jgi:membrane associated rhomboid family serine protease